MAEALMNRELKIKDKSDISVYSAGLGALVGEMADNKAQQAVRHLGLDISSHRAVQVQSTMLSKADLILVMESSHRGELRNQYPAVNGKVFRLGEWRGWEIFDPYQESLDFFRFTMERIELSVDDWLRRI